MKFAKFLFALLCGIATAAAIAQVQPPLPPGIQFITEVEGIREYRLDNGLQVLLFPDSSKPITTVNITYKVGSRHENYGETGMAHLLEHLLFKGSPKYPTLWQEMADRGFNNNGTTWFDRTNYYESFPASEVNLKWAIDMEADRMVNAWIRAEDLKSEMTVVRSEFEMGETNPFQVMMKRMGSVAYDWHAYGKSTIGNKSDIENVKIENLQAFYRLHYQPDNASLLIGGKFNPEQTLRWVSAAFGQIAKPTRTLPTLWTVEPTQDGERSFAVRRASDTQMLMAGYKTPPGVHADYPAIELLSEILGDNTTGRLHKTLVESKLAASVYGISFATHDPGLLMLGAQLRKDAALAPAREALLKAIESDIRDGFSDEEVKRAINSWLKEFDETLRAPDRLSVAVSEAVAQGDWRLMFLHRDRIRAASVADVNRVAKAYLKASNRTLGEFIPTDTPDRAELPVRADLAALLKDYKGDAVVSAGEDFDPTPANILARSQHHTLANGMQITLMPKKTRGETVRVAISLRHGSLQSLRGQRLGGMVSPMLLRGTASLDRKAIKDRFDALKASVQLGVSGGSIETTRANLPAVLDLVAQVLREANFPPDEFERLRQETLTALEAQRKEPQPLAANQLQQHMNRFERDDPRYLATLEERIAEVRAVTRDQAFAYYKRFMGGNAGSVSLVGDFDAAAVRTQLEKSLGDWRAPEAYARIPNVFHDVQAGDFKINTPDKANATLFLAQALPLNDTAPDFPAMVLAEHMLGEHSGSRLFMRVREKEGLSYAVGSQLTVGSYEPVGQILFYAISAPQNVAKTETAIRDEISRTLREGFATDELTKAKESWLQQRVAARAEDASVAAGWNRYKERGRDFGFAQTLDDTVRALTVAEVNAALRKYLGLGKLTVVRAGDFAKSQ